MAASAVNVQQPGDITVPGRKLLDIVLERLRTSAENQHEYVLTARAAYVKSLLGSGKVWWGMQDCQLAADVK